MPRLRFSTLVIIVIVFVTVSLLLSSSSPLSDPSPSLHAAAIRSSQWATKLPTFTVPGFRFSFHQSSHRPPEQRNSTSGDSSWYSDWKWLNPFSSSITLDENRAVLPPLPERLPVYTYYDAAAIKDDETAKVDQELLLTWKRAWWAHGFRPVILSQAEAVNNPLYQQMQGKGMPSALEFEFFRWLAWGHMGSGLLASWHCVPMGAYDDPLLSHLRRGTFERLTRFEGLGAGLFAGEKTQINSAIQNALGDLKLNTYKSIVEAISPDRFKIEQPTSIAHYDASTIAARYPALTQILVDDPSKGRLALNDLIISHLHTIWQNTFSSGIAVLKPLPAHTTALVDPALRLATLLAQCRESILPSSCPPNRPKCSPCVATKLAVNTPPAFRNTSTLYTISTVPHPYTMIMLSNQSDAITLSHIRRRTDRDQWLTMVTRDILGDGRGGPSRVMALKDAIASEYGRSRSLWFTVEQFPGSLTSPPPKVKSPTNPTHADPPTLDPFPESWLENLDWHFGFPIPRNIIPHGESIPPVPGPERVPKIQPGLPERRRKSSDPNPPTDEQLAIEVELLQQAREIIRSKDKRVGRIRDVAEAWNLADTEAWKFARAYRARSVVERKKWEEEESAYDIPGAVKGKSRWWG